MDVDEEWEAFMCNGNDDTLLNTRDNQSENNFVRDHDELDHVNIDAPVPGDLYISTKSKIAYLNSPITLNDVFWKLPVIKYTTVKKWHC